MWFGDKKYGFIWTILDVYVCKGPIKPNFIE